ncbi:hypothetical protein ACI8AG_06610 [Blastococcus sp. SYSU DS0552]
MNARAEGRRRVVARLVSGAGLVAGAGLLAEPGAVLARLVPRYPEPLLWVTRVLGARLIAQHALVLVRPDSARLRLAAGVDALHAASMLPVLALPRYRRAALVSSGVAAVSALAAERLARSERR